MVHKVRIPRSALRVFAGVIGATFGVIAGESYLFLNGWLEEMDKELEREQGLFDFMFFLIAGEIVTYLIVCVIVFISASGIWLIAFALRRT